MDLARVVPAVLICARAWAAKTSAGELGLVALLPKPFDLQDLMDIVRTSKRANDHTPTARAVASPSEQPV
jgi:hypothetical protein